MSRQHTQVYTEAWRSYYDAAMKYNSHCCDCADELLQRREYCPEIPLRVGSVGETLLTPNNLVV